MEFFSPVAGRPGGTFTAVIEGRSGQCAWLPPGRGEGMQAGRCFVVTSSWHLIHCGRVTGIGISRALHTFVTVLFVLLWSFLQFSAPSELLRLPDKCVWLWVRLSQRRVPFRRFCFGIFLAGEISTCMREFSWWNTGFQHAVEFTYMWD